MTLSPAPTRSSGPVRLKASRPDDLLALVPYLLGFHPRESLVVVLVRDGCVLLTARTDLAPFDPGPPEVKVPVPLDCVQDLVDQHGATTVVLAAYSEQQPLARRVLSAHVDGLVRVHVADALLVDGSRWWSLTCSAGCCPPQGRPYRPKEHPFAAEAVYAGLSASVSREEVVAAVAGPDPASCATVRALAAEVRPELRRLGRAGREEAMVAAVVSGLSAGPATDEAACVRLAMLGREVQVRDVACALITRADADQHVALWQRVVGAVPPELAPAPLCLLGIAGWAAGNGALLNCCADRVHRLDPGYSMGRLLDDVSARALPSSLWDALAAELRGDLGLVAG